jgi:hypothetical protein
MEISMSELLDLVLRAHGGLDRWRKLSKVSATIVAGGGLLPMKGLDVDPKPLSGRGRGVITVECLRLGEDRHRVVIADDGVGLPEGVAWPVPGKIGALIVQTLRENAKTDFNVESAPGRGVRVTMNIDRRAAARNAP